VLPGPYIQPDGASGEQYATAKHPPTPGPGRHHLGTPRTMAIQRSDTGESVMQHRRPHARMTAERAKAR